MSPYPEKMHRDPVRPFTAMYQAAAIAASLARLPCCHQYNMPLAVAGGYVRDLAMGNHPKDLDVFLDGGVISTAAALEMAEGLAKELNQTISIIVRNQPTGLQSYVKNVVHGSYGEREWAEDVEFLITICVPGDVEWFKDLGPRPANIDLIFLRREALEKYGYNPSRFDRREQHESFLSAVLQRVDTRVNAIGATNYEGTDRNGNPEAVAFSPWFCVDAHAHTLVVQWARRDAITGAIPERIMARLARQTGLGAKFATWMCREELNDTGSITAPLHL